MCKLNFIEVFNQVLIKYIKLKKKIIFWVFGFFGYSVFKLPSKDFNILKNLKLKNKFTLLLPNLYASSIFNAFLVQTCFNLSFSVSKFLKLIGTGYKFFLSKSKLLFYLGYSHLLSYEISVNNNFFIKLIKKKGLFFKSISSKLNQIVLSFKFLKKCDVYKGKGFCFFNEVLYKKQGKVVK